MSAIDILRSFAETNMADDMLIPAGVTYGAAREALAEIKHLIEERDSAVTEAEAVGATSLELVREREALRAKVGRLRDRYERQCPTCKEWKEIDVTEFDFESGDDEDDGVLCWDCCEDEEAP